MALLKELLLDINKTLSIPGIEALSGASDIAAIEIDDDTMTQTSSKLGGLMSLDAAKNNHDIEDHFKKKLHPTIKGELLGNLDTDVTSTVKSLFGDEAVEQLKEKEFTGEKIKLFGELTKSALEAKGSGEENDKIKAINVDLNKQIVSLNGNIDKLTKDGQKALKKAEQGFDETLIDKEFNSVFNSYILGDVYNKDMFKNALRTDIRSQVKKVAKLTLSEDKTRIVPRNPENDGLELFVENKKIEKLRDVLDPLMAGHIKVNNVDTKKKDGYTPAPEVKKSTLAMDIMSRKKELLQE